MKVELIYDSDCPNVAEARANLLQAFAATHLDAKWTEWGSVIIISPCARRRYSKTPVAPGKRSVGASCRRRAPHPTTRSQARSCTSGWVAPAALVLFITTHTRDSSLPEGKAVTNSRLEQTGGRKVRRASQ